MVSVRERTFSVEAATDWVKRVRKPRWKASGAAELSVVDLFCGCGGMTLGVFEAARQSRRRFSVKLAVDIDESPLGVFRSNFDCDELVAQRDNVASLFSGSLGARLSREERNLAKLSGDVSVVVSGPPCQGHSDLNNSTRRDDPRNEFYLSTIRAVEVLRPKAAIVENVPTVVHDRGNVTSRARTHLESLGYVVTENVLELARFGIPQVRKRHVLIAHRGTDEFELRQSRNGVVVPSIGEFLAGLEDEPDRRNEIFCQPGRMTDENRERVDWLFENDALNLPNELRPSCHRDKPHSYVSMYGRLDWNAPAQTITTGFGSMGQGRYVHPKRKRTITPHEAARIQGFPDFFDFSPASGITALRKMIGNAAPPQLTLLTVLQLIRSGLI